MLFICRIVWTDVVGTAAILMMKLLLLAVSTCFEQGNAGLDKSIWMSTSHKLDSNNILSTHYANDLKGGKRPLRLFACISITQEFQYLRSTEYPFLFPAFLFCEIGLLGCV